MEQDQATVIDYGPGYELTKVVHTPSGMVGHRLWLGKQQTTYRATVMLGSVAVSCQPYRRKRDAMDWIVLALIILRETDPRERYAMASRMGTASMVPTTGQGAIHGAGM